MTSATSPTGAIVCRRGIDCAHDKPGHAMTFMRQRMGHLDSGKFVNATVIDFDGEWAILEDVFTGKRYLAWNHEDLRTALWGGDLVAISVTYNMLAIRDDRFNVIVMEVPNAELQFESAFFG